MFQRFCRRHPELFCSFVPGCCDNPSQFGTDRPACSGSRTSGPRLCSTSADRRDNSWSWQSRSTGSSSRMHLAEQPPAFRRVGLRSRTFPIGTEPRHRRPTWLRLLLRAKPLARVRVGPLARLQAGPRGLGLGRRRHLRATGGTSL